MIVIIPRNKHGSNQITLIKRVLIIMDELGVIWNKRKSSYPRLNETNKRGRPAQEELYRTIINKYDFEDIPIDIEDNLFNVLFKQLCHLRNQPSADDEIDYYENNMNNHTLCFIDSWDNLPVSTDDYYIIMQPSQDYIDHKMTEYCDNITDTVDDKVDYVFCIKSKIDQFELTTENKIELIKYLLI
jgi:hypothetical protein